LSARKKPNGELPGKQGKAKKKSLTLDQKLIKALAHPMRVEILALVNDREWSPNELAEELVEGLSQVSYHVKVLRDYEMIEMTKTEPRRGAVEHFYRAIKRAYIPTEMAVHIPKSGRNIIANSILKEIDKDLGASVKSGKFYERDDRHVTWTPADLDEEGCAEANEAADEFVKRFVQVEANSANRRAESEDGGEHIAVSAAVLVFPSEHGEKKKASSRKPRKRKSRKRKKSS
jgi:DNA-binding transcriptional ArsR family regulator